jgi:MerR family transcriptional regulator, light-induced transcriptional regulator
VHRCDRLNAERAAESVTEQISERALGEDPNVLSIGELQFRALPLFASSAGTSPVGVHGRARVERTLDPAARTRSAGAARGRARRLLTHRRQDRAGELARAPRAFTCPRMRFSFSLPDSALELTAAYLQATLIGDAGEAVRLAMEQGVSAGVSPAELELRMILPAQREVGRLWEENRISVAQEHLATSISQLVMSHLYAHLPRPVPNGRRILVACVEGELHELGARMGADFLEMAGFDVHFLGAHVPHDVLREAVRERAPDLLGLSATMPFHRPALEKAVAQVRTVAPLLPIIVGGAFVEQMPGLGASLGVQACGADAEALVSQVRGLLQC